MWASENTVTLKNLCVNEWPATTRGVKVANFSMESGVETCTRAAVSSLSLLFGSVWVGPCWRRRWTRCCPCWPESPFPVSSRPASCRGRRSSPGGRRRTPAARPDCPCRTHYAPESHAEEEGGWWQETYTSWCDSTTCWQVSHNATHQNTPLFVWITPEALNPVKLLRMLLYMTGTCDSPHRRKDVQPCRRCSLWFLCREPALWPHNTHITDEAHTNCFTHSNRLLEPWTHLVTP